MNVWTALILGLLAGWLIEWVIDWMYWRGRRATLLADVDSARAERDRLRAELDVVRRDAGEVVSLRDALSACRADGQRLETELTTAQGIAPQLRAELTQTQADLKTAQAEIGRLREELGARDARPQTASFAAGAPAVLGSIPDGPVDTELNGENARLRTELQSLRTAFASLRRSQHDPLIDINGIGPVYEKKLFEAGIYTFAQLAVLTSDQVRAIIKPEKWQDIDPEAWIAEARMRADGLKVRSASA